MKKNNTPDFFQRVMRLICVEPFVKESLSGTDFAAIHKAKGKIHVVENIQTHLQTLDET